MIFSIYFVFINFRAVEFMRGEEIEQVRGRRIEADEVKCQPVVIIPFGDEQDSVIVKLPLNMNRYCSIKSYLWQWMNYLLSWISHSCVQSPVCFLGIKW